MMAQPFRQLFLIVRLIAAAALGPACGQLFDYPEVQLEQSIESCRDGIDNDLDGRTDCEDSECAPHCRENTEERCRDGVDNDRDGEQDCDDLECAETCGESSERTCQDGGDNDRDGNTDCNDADCAKFCPEADVTSCSDEKDNDFDGDVDCNDLGCEGFCPEESAADCDDGLDNDGDRLVDAADPRCWLRSPPKVERCAQALGVQVVEKFDSLLVPELSPIWAFYGLRRSTEYLSLVPASRRRYATPQDRADMFMSFEFNTTQSETLDDNLGAVVKQRAFSGAWADFQLSFTAAAPLGTLLRVGLVPIHLAPETDRPRPGAESALLSVTLDAAASPPTLTLNVEGVASSKALPIGRNFCGTTTVDCDENWARVDVKLDGEGILVTFARPNETSIEVRGPSPSSPILSRSRLVFWGGSTHPGRYSAFDDVSLNVMPHRPCGFPTPQIPGTSCEYSGKYSSFGQTVSVGQGDDGEFCALVTANPDPRSVSANDDVTAWQSPDGVSWAVASVETALSKFLESSALLGAGIARGGDRWHVAIMYRDGEDIRLGFTEGEHCGSWATIKGGPTLFADAEPPSYVISEGRHEVYFTRPSTERARRTLWRVTLGASDSTSVEPELLAELPAAVGAPITVQRIGARDLVLTYPEALVSNPSGVGVLVADERGRSWWNIDPAPILLLPESLPPLNNGRLGFDDGGAVSAALAWGPKGGFLLYGGSSVPYRDEPAVLAASTARLVPADQSFPRSSETLHGCGNATCEAQEDCTTCPVDCPCGGVEVLADVFATGTPWQLVSEEIPGQVNPMPPSACHYLDPQSPALNWCGITNTWSVLPLAHPIGADFELSFDFLLSARDRADVWDRRLLCTFYVGLGTARNLTPDNVVNAPPASAGLFARFEQSTFCSETYRVSPAVEADRTLFEEKNETLIGLCSGDHALAVDTWQHVTLRREGSTVSVLVPRRDGCGFAERGITYSGALTELPNLIIGNGGGAFSPCEVYAGAGTVANVRLRLLDDPAACPESKELCTTDSQEPSCVDLRTSAEHCGACGRACGPHEACVEGRCACGAFPGTLECHGICVDSLTSPVHCGACDNACPATCQSGRCDFLTGDCRSPIPLLPETTAVDLDFSSQSSGPGSLCGLPVDSLVTLGWISPVSGFALIDVTAEVTDLKTVVGVTDDVSCRTWYDCGISGSDLGLGLPVTKVVSAGMGYAIRVGLVSGGSQSSQATLRIQVQ